MRKLLYVLIIISIFSIIITSGCVSTSSEDNIVGVWKSNEGVQYWYLFVSPDGEALFAGHMIDEPRETHAPLRMTWEEKSNNEYVFRGGSQTGLYVLSDDGRSLQFTVIPDRVYTKILSADSWKELIEEYPDSEKMLASTYMLVVFEEEAENNPPEWYEASYFIKNTTFDPGNTIPDTIEDTIKTIASSFEMIDLLFFYNYGFTYEFSKIESVYDESNGAIELVYEFKEIAEDGSWIMERMTISGSYDSNTKSLHISTIRIDFDLTNKYSQYGRRYEVDTYYPEYIIRYISEKECEAIGNPHNYTYKIYYSDGTSR